MTESELTALAIQFRTTPQVSYTHEVARALSEGYLTLKAERDSLLVEVTAQMDGSAGAGVLQAVLDAIKGTLDPHTQIADHPNVKFAQMERLKLEAERDALKAENEQLRGSCERVAGEFYDMAKERDALKAQVASEYDRGYRDAVENLGEP